MDYMKIAIKEAKKAEKKGDVPVGTIIVENGKIIAKAHNQREYKNITTKHAEIIAIEKACKKKKNWRLNDCEIYTTLKPCEMCMGVIKSSRLKTIYYATENESTIFFKQKEIKIKKYELETKNIIKNFFCNKRK